MVNRLNWTSIAIDKKEIWDRISTWVHSSWISSINFRITPRFYFVSWNK